MTDAKKTKTTIQIFDCNGNPLTNQEVIDIINGAILIGADYGDDVCVDCHGEIKDHKND